MKTFAKVVVFLSASSMVWYWGTGSITSYPDRDFAEAMFGIGLVVSTCVFAPMVNDLCELLGRKKWGREKNIPKFREAERPLEPVEKPCNCEECRQRRGRK